MCLVFSVPCIICRRRVWSLWSQNRVRPIGIKQYFPLWFSRGKSLPLARDASCSHSLGIFQSRCVTSFLCVYIFFLVNFFKLSKMSKSFVTEIQGLKTRYRRALNYIFSSANSLSNKLLEKKCFSPMDLSKTKNMYFEFFSAVFLWWCRVVKWA